MLRQFGIKVLITLSTLGMLSSCANVSRPTGGVKDKTPPKLDTVASSPLNPVNFKKSDIHLVFDEYLVLQDIFKNVLISPPLDPTPEIKSRGKSIIIHFEDEDTLQANTTYQIQFGNAIKDLNEGNPYPNFTYVFSTGGALDSLNFTCTTLDAVTKLPVGKILVALYDNNRDSTPIQRKPNYAGKTNDAGVVNLQYLKAGTYYVCAWKDDNSDFLYQPETESFGFMPDSVQISATKNNIGIVRISLKDKKLIPPEIDSSMQGKLTFTFNRAPDGFQLKMEPALPEVYTWTEKEKIFLLHQSSDTLSRLLYLKGAGYADTIQVRSIQGRNFKEKIKIVQGQKNESPIPDPVWKIYFSLPVQKIDSSKIQLTQGANKKPMIAAFILDPTKRSLGIDSKWVADSSYQVIFLPGALTDWFGNINDSLQVPLKVSNPELYGNLILSIEGLDSTTQVILQLKIKDQVMRESIWEAGRKDPMTIRHMLPETYEAWIIVDENRNGRWDPASYSEKRQAEYIYRKMLEPLRANWDLEVHLIPEISKNE